MDKPGLVTSAIGSTNPKILFMTGDTPSAVLSAAKDRGVLVIEDPAPINSIIHSAPIEFLLDGMPITHDEVFATDSQKGN